MALELIAEPMRAGQRFALAAGGRDVDSLREQKNPKPEKCLKTAQNPTSRLQALFGGFSF